MSMDILKFKDAFVRFSGYFLNDTRVIWISGLERNEVRTERSLCRTKENIRRKFSYVTPDNDLLKKHRLESFHEKDLMADRYGGYGLGPNGGGARTAIIDGYQVKGVGRNPLAGFSDTEWHSYGGQSLVDAVLEAINSEVYDLILPIGTVKCHAVIFTGDDTAYMPTGDWGSETGPGALLIRDLCMRPAHFFRASTFQMRTKFEGTMLDDVERTRCVNVQLHSDLGGHNEVIKFLGNFLSNCANQFAFARVFRIYHGVLSPSNISFDGRWLDLTNISFVDAGINYRERPELISFYDEAKIALRIIDEFVYTYTKYNRTEFNIKPLVDYYREEFDAYVACYMSRLVGICHEWICKSKISNSYSNLVNQFKKMLFGYPRPVVAAPTGLCLNDPVACLLRELFSTLPESDSVRKNELHRLFSDVFEHAFKSANLESSYCSFVTAAAIHSLKKALFSSFFTRGRIIAQLLVRIKTLEPEALEGYIEDHINVAKWLFENEANATAIVFKSHRFELRYCVDEEKYTAATNHTADETFQSARALRDWVECREEEVFFLDNYNFRPGLLQILVVLDGLEKLKTPKNGLRQRMVGHA